MRFPTVTYILVGLFVLLQMRCSAQESETEKPADPKNMEEPRIFFSYNPPKTDIRNNAFNLLKRFNYVFHNYYVRIVNMFKCTAPNAMGVIDQMIYDAIKCLNEPVREPQSDLMELMVPTYSIRRCLQKGLAAVNNFMKTVDFTGNHCRKSLPNTTVSMGIKKSLVTSVNIDVNDGWNTEKKKILCQIDDLNNRNAPRQGFGDIDHFADHYFNGSDFFMGKGEITKRGQNLPVVGVKDDKSNNPPDVVFGEIPYY